MKLFLSTALLVLAIIAPAKAQIETYEFDQPHTQVLFFIDHLGFAKSQGEFHQVDGTFTFDRTKPENSKIDVSIQTESIDMDLDKWNAHMKNEDFFHVEKYPAMTFKSTAIDVTGEKLANITGDLTILETTKPVTLAVTHNKCGKHPFSGKYICGFSATTSIKRSEFGMTYGLPAIGDDVEIRLEVEGIRTDDGR